MSEKLAVNGILIAGASEQRLLITKVVVDESSQLPYIQDAQVEVNGVQFAPIPLDRIDPQNPFNWITSGLEINCGQLCSLTVQYEQQEIRGKTMVPPTIEPVSIYNATISWRGDSSIRDYSIWVNDVFFSYIPETTFDVSRRYFNFHPGRYRVRILAFDENYSRTITSDAASIGIEGAYGLFASACAWEDSVDLK